MMSVYRKTILFTAVGLIGFSSCKSGVTLDEVREQEQETIGSLHHARDQMAKLIRLKEDYSEDSRKRRLDEFRDRLKKIDKDIENLENVDANNNTDVESGVGTAISSLKSDRVTLQNQIKSLEETKREDWSQSLEMLNQQIMELEQEISRITANLPAE